MLTPEDAAIMPPEEGYALDRKEEEAKEVPHG